MSDRYRPLDVSMFPQVTPVSSDLGTVPALDWMYVRSLVVDTTYQREIARRGKNNIMHIAQNFDWSRFTPVIVAAIEKEGVFAIVDGQHRSTAALLRGIEKVPCQVIFVDAVEQAAAFADINAQVTAITPLQIHSARLAAKDPAALALVAACKAGGVEICRYPVPADKMKVGQTMAVGTLARLLDVYGSGTLSLALRCITQTGSGNVGLIRGTIIRAICFTLDAEPAYKLDEKKLFACFDELDLETALDQAVADRRRTRMTTEAALCSIVFRHVEKHLGKVAA